MFESKLARKSSVGLKWDKASKVIAVSISSVLANHNGIGASLFLKKDQNTGNNDKQKRK